MMRKREQVAGFTGAALVLQPARAALPVCASAVKFAASQNAAARPAQTSLETPKLSEHFSRSWCFPIHSWVIEAHYCRNSMFFSLDERRDMGH